MKSAKEDHNVLKRAMSALGKLLSENQSNFVSSLQHEDTVAVPLEVLRADVDDENLSIEAIAIISRLIATGDAQVCTNFMTLNGLSVITASAMSARYAHRLSPVIYPI